MEFESVADELYGLAPAEFTPTRDLRAAQAKKGGDAALATSIKQLRRPTTSAWLINVLGRERPDQVDALLQLGAVMRDALAGLRGDELRQLTTQRRQLVTAITREATRLASERGHRVNDGAVGEVASTLEAGLADPAAADAIAGGRLTVALTYSGLGIVEAAGTGDGRSLPPPRPRKGIHRNESERSPRRQSEDANRALQTARTAAAEAERTAAALRRRVNEVQERVVGLQRQIEALEEQMTRLRREEEHATATLATIEGQLAEASSALESSKETVVSRRAALAKPRQPPSH